MSIKLKTLSAAVGLVMGTAAVNASAEALLFPYFASGNGAYTFLTLRSDANPKVGGDNAPFASNPLHYVWNYNDPTYGQCTHYDANGSMSKYDLIQQTVVSPSSPGGLPLPQVFGDKSNAAYLQSTAPTVGFLTVQDSFLVQNGLSIIPPNYSTGNEGGLSGQAIVVDTVTGVVFAYKGLNNIVSTYEGDFSNILTSARSHDLTWYPTNRANTSWFVLVTGRPTNTAAPYIDPIPAGQPANPAGMANSAGWRGVRSFSNGFGGVFDRDETFLSFNRPFPVTCYDTIDRSSFMNAAQLVATQGGGWNWLVNSAVNSDFDPTLAGVQGAADGADTSGATGAVIVKIESTTQLGPIKTAISWENAYPNLPY